MRPKLFLGVLYAALTLSCGSPNRPGEMPPLAPRPDPVEPGGIGRGQPGRTPGDSNPVPGAPDPTAPKPDASPTTLREVPMPTYGASSEFGAAPSDDDAIVMQKVKETPDAALGGGDAAAPLPPVPDALPVDASMSNPKPKH